jgi:PHP family Zn ribbon phosphoesterase
MTQADPIRNALRLPNGARFFRCALQINPFDYLKRHKKPTPYKDEASYNAAIVQACIEEGIEVIAVTDHYRVRTAVTLWSAAKEKGIQVFPGFEAVSKDGVHFLCLFDQTKKVEELERVLGDCGIHDDAEDSPLGQHYALDLLAKSHSWGAVCIAAHVASKGGLLESLTASARIQVWKSMYLLACSLPGPIDDAPDNLRSILKNKNPEYQRERPVAVLNAQDVCSPADLKRPGASSFIKMSELSGEGLRQAFLDPDSRIRLSSAPAPEEHAEFVAITWQGGFLDGSAIHLNENLNVLIGGRGTGKSTVVESIRYALALEPLGEEATELRDGLVRQVLRSGTKISLLVRSHRPVKREYLIERTIPNPPVIRDEGGNVLALMPSDLVPNAEVYGQHEISELTKSPEKLTRLLERFVERDPSLSRKKADLSRELERSRARILDIRRELTQIEERLSALPALEETLKRFQQAGLEDKLKEQSLIVREERVLRTVLERLAPVEGVAEQLRRDLSIDTAFLGAKALEDLPGREILAEAKEVLDQLSRDLARVSVELSKLIEEAKSKLTGIRARWDTRRSSVQAEYERLLRELQKSKIDGEEFIRLRRQIEELRPLRERLVSLTRDEKENAAQRRNLLAEWEDAKTEEFRKLEAAAKKVSKRLDPRVRVKVEFAGDREPLVQLLKKNPGGRLAETIEILRKRESLSLVELAEACRGGRNILEQKFAIPAAQAERLRQASPDLYMLIEELDLPSTTAIQLNIAAEGHDPVWKALDDLSTGQKATAVLLLLLLESDAPLVVDQPEDDLDNRFITEGVVPKMREEKRRRQFVFATHNANIPVLGDAELIVGLRASGEGGHGHAEIPQEHMGSIDSKLVRELVEEVLEGGREAFEWRRLKYGF